MSDAAGPTRFGGILDECGRPAVGWAHHSLAGWWLVCEGCWQRFADPMYRRRPLDPVEGQSSLFVACECACGHVAGGPLEHMDRTAEHLRCPDCVTAGHPSTERSAESFAADPRVVPQVGPRGRDAT